MTPAKKRAYHHGDLRNALIEEAIALAKDGGPEAIVLREAARKVGVSATAAYRHFSSREELKYVVKEYALDQLAVFERRKLRSVPRTDDPQANALAELEALGRGYVAFALAHPGLFRVAFASENPSFDAQDRSNPAFAILAAAVDKLVAVGCLDPKRRPCAELAAWAAVHGVALLILDGPLGALPKRGRAAAVDRTVSMVLESMSGR